MTTTNIMLDKTFTAALHKSPAKGGWTYVVTDWSADFFGTRGLVKIAGTVDDQPFRWHSQAGNQVGPTRTDR
jgi:hypothetical protein